ncbi:DMT family transporter [Hahella aquimaris]|uniref:DMT family transporter n=1 Tax=Hahella sp. HNIBRBA332 TaxID=3015983 RepID=UPI00273CCC13|nr:DMT family transporter [Hahella sp. HNIBRBA332]WLQ12337.1 DMT family transporter [Hahella sp. HNIBRBA332]
MRAALMALCGFFFFTWMDLSIKHLLATYPLPQVIFFNCLFALLALSVWVAPRWTLLKTSRPGLHLARAVMLLLVDALAFYSYGAAPLTEAYSLILTMPVFVAVFAMAMNIERFDTGRFMLALVGFVGALVVLSPSFGVVNMALLPALASAMIEAAAFIIVAKYKDQEHPLAFAVYGLSLIVVVTGCWPGWSLFSFDMSALTISAAGGVCYALATLLVLSAFQSGSPSTVSAMQYSQLVWGMALAYVFWEETPASLALIGALLIVASGLLLMRWEISARRARKRAPVAI